MLKRIIVFLVVLMAALVIGPGEAFGEFLYSEEITVDGTTRSVKINGGAQIITYDTSLAGNAAFGQPTTSLLFEHVLQVHSPVPADAVIRSLSFRLQIRNRGGSDLVMYIDSVEYTKPSRKLFLVGPGPQDYVEMTASPLADSKVEVSLVSQSQFTAVRSMMTVHLAGGVETDVSESSDVLPVKPELRPNYPNPFNPSTTIEFALPRRAHVRVEVVNVLGQPVRLLMEGEVPMGTHKVDWDGCDADGLGMPSGVYFYRVTSDGFVDSRKMMLLK